MKKSWMIDRRTVLRGAGGAALALPFLDAMTRPFSARRRGLAHAAADGSPKRVVFFFTPNGFVRSKWMPTGSETSFTLSPILAPLEPHKGQIIVLKGVDNKAAYASVGSANHVKGALTILTARPGYKADGFDGLPSGISLDQELAGRIGKTTKLPSLELGVQTSNGEPSVRITFSGPGTGLPAENDPGKTFARLFGDLRTDPALERLRAERRTVLDLVKQDLAALQPKLGASDRQRIEAHAQAIREIENGLGGAGGGAGACTPPAAPPTLDPKLPASFPQVGRLQMDLLVRALACDLTRVATFQWSNRTSGVRHTWLGIDDDHHYISHAPDEDAAAQAKLVRIGTWYAEQLAYLLAALKSVREGDGTLLDKTVVVWVSDVAVGNNHYESSLPLVLAGSCGGAFRTGRFLSYGGNVGVYTDGGISHGNLLVSILNAVGVATNTFGDPKFATGPLPGLTG